jgi:ribosomal protein S18 acetylase RimI-like enzyme
VREAKVVLRTASTDDVEAIAALHADSWRRHYRGAYSDAFLDGDVFAERRMVWNERLTAMSASQFTIVAERNAEVVGFVHMILDESSEWGALLDNLHVSYHLKRYGIGRRLLTGAARELIRRSADSRFYLWVLDQNTEAQAFYIACGGRDVEISLHGPMPDGSSILSHRIVWSDATVFPI